MVEVELAVSLQRQRFVDAWAMDVAGRCGSVVDDFDGDIFVVIDVGRCCGLGNVVPDSVPPSSVN